MNTLIYKIHCFLFTLLHPTYWVMNEDYDETWDKELIMLINHYNFSFTSNKYTAMINNLTVWTANRPYCCLTPYLNGSSLPLRASRLTIYRAIKKLKHDQVIEFTNNIKNGER